MRINDEPQLVDIKIVDGVFLKSSHFRDAGMIGLQHAHRYAHISHISSGAVRVTADDKVLGTFTAGASIEIPAHVRHSFVTLLPNTVVLCIHNADHAEHGAPVIEEVI